MADGEDRSTGVNVKEGDLIQVNEDGPGNWYRCILVVDTVKDWGVRAYCITPGEDARSHDLHAHLAWGEFDRVGAKSLFIAVEAPEA